MNEGLVVALLFGRVKGGPMEQLTQARLVAGLGIEGDRYSVKGGTFSSRKARTSAGLALTLIEMEAIEDVRRREGIALDLETTRRNVVTSGIRLIDLIGEDFWLGTAKVRGAALNPPCSRLEKLAGIPGLKRAMTGRGGIRADVIQSGVVRVGDRLVLPSGRVNSEVTAGPELP